MYLQYMSVLNSHIAFLNRSGLQEEWDKDDVDESGDEAVSEPLCCSPCDQSKCCSAKDPRDPAADVELLTAIVVSVLRD